MNKNKFLKNTIIYFLLILGYVYLYIANVEVVVNPDAESEPKSIVDFVYQQF